MKQLFLFLCLFFASAVQAQVVDFNYSTTSGSFCDPQTVTFTQNCTGNPGGFIWNFGNGQSNVHATDTAVYLTPGTYTVTLIALYADTAIPKSKTITINAKPVVSLSSDKDQVCQPGDIIFTANGAGLINFIWNFGDGSPVVTTTTNTFTHTYAGLGQFNAQVIGTTAFGCRDTADKLIRIESFNINGTINPTTGCIPVNAVLSVTTDIPPPDAPQTYLWDFGDGSPLFTGTTPMVTHPYNVTDTVKPILTITSVSGCVGIFNFPFAAYGIPPINILANTLSGMDTFCGAKLIEFKAVATGADSYIWYFGDGSNMTVFDSMTTYEYQDTGAMQVIVISQFHGCPGARDTFNIYIKGVVAKFDAGNTCANKNTFFLNNYSEGLPTHFEWTFSDDPSIRDSLQYDITHTFPPVGATVVTLMLTDTASGCADTLSKVIYTAQPVFTSSKPIVCKDSLITYTVSNSFPFGVQYFFHVVGSVVDNSGDSILNFVPLNHGNYTDFVVLDHHSSFICNDTLFLSGPTKVAGPVTDFTVNPDTVCLRIPVAFTNNTHPFFPADNIVTWNWNFFDGNSANVQNPPPHLYTTPGQYFVSLTATDVNGCALAKQVLVVVDPIPEMTVYPRKDTICLNRDTATLTAYSIDPFVWTPATNISCTNCDTIKVYPQVTTYYIATATNVGGCSASDTSTVKVYAPFAILATGSTAICAGLTVPLNVNTNGVIRWSPAASLNDSTVQAPLATPLSTVMYTVIVTDSAGCYADTAYADVLVYPIPVVNAGTDKLVSNGTNFTLSPQYSPGTTTYLWTPKGDLACDNCPQPTGIATQSLTYTVNVTDANGCTAKDDVKISLRCEKSGLYLPSAFTPFNGGENNYFYPLARGFKRIKTFLVYNRFGNKVFERKDFAPNIATLGWNGTMAGDSRGEGTQAFVWYIEAICEQGEMISSKGTVVLVR